MRSRDGRKTWEKVFYCLLYRYRTRNLENFNMDEEEIRLTKQRKATPRMFPSLSPARHSGADDVRMSVFSSECRQTSTRRHSRSSRSSNPKISYFDFEHCCRCSETTSIHRFTSYRRSTCTCTSFRRYVSIDDASSRFRICYSSRFTFGSYSSTASHRSREWCDYPNPFSCPRYSPSRIDSRSRRSFTRSSSDSFDSLP